MKIKGQIWLLGDTHSVDFTEMVLAKGVTNATVIHVGDAGISNHFAERAPYLEEFMRERNIRLIIIRGNHDNPMFFPAKWSPYLTLIDDYTTLEFEDLNLKALCVGGGISLDRTIRTIGFDYWVGEPTKDVPEDLADDYDLVIAHDCPSWQNHSTESLPQSWARMCAKDPTLIADCSAQRAKMDEIFAKTQPSMWYYGHYHNDCYEFDRNCHFKCLNINYLHFFG